MKRKLRKIFRLKRYFEQKKNAELIELKKAMAERYRKAHAFESISSEKFRYVGRFASALTGSIDPTTFHIFEGGVRYYNERLSRIRMALESALDNERKKKEAVLSASITHKMWENLYSRNEKRLKTHIERKAEREADDSALLKINSSSIHRKRR